MVGALVLFISATIVSGELFSDEDNARLPSLFHLDDHDRCLLQKDGLYCLGVFDLSPIEPSPVYEYITEYSSNPFTFNRSRLHRGYCVSARCPSTERNATLRFERCVDERARRHALSARINRLQYCTTEKQHRAKAEQPPDAAQQVFLQVVCALIVLNLVGTVYDFATEDSGKKNDLLKVWSVRASWRRLTAKNDDGDPRLNDLEPIQGLRVMCMLLTMYAHANVYHFQAFVTNPSYLESLTYRADGVMLMNGTSVIQMYVMISTFLTAYKFLLDSEKQQLSFLRLPVLVIKRIFRIAPVHLLLVGFAATWWPQTRSGALSAIIGENSAICRRKFWTHALFLNNVVEKHDVCLTPTWFLPVDMHLYIVACALTTVMSRRRHQALRLYVFLFIISAVVCGVVSYVTGWQALIYYAVPDVVRGVFSSSESLGGFYTSSWGSLPACFAGLFMAHLHYELQERKYNCNDNRWLKYIHYWSKLVATAWVILAGTFIRHYKHPLVSAAYVALDRPVFCFFMFFIVFGVCNIDSVIRSFCGWRGFREVARLSLPIMLCHWLVNAVISARPATYRTSAFDVLVDYLANVFISYLAAVPIALLVEIPMQRFFFKFF